jgi:hypothetical protein
MCRVWSGLKRSYPLSGEMQNLAESPFLPFSHSIRIVSRHLPPFLQWRMRLFFTPMLSVIIRLVLARVCACGQVGGVA